MRLAARVRRLEARPGDAGRPVLVLTLDGASDPHQGEVAGHLFTRQPGEPLKGFKARLVALAKAASNEAILVTLR